MSFFARSFLPLFAFSAYAAVTDPSFSTDVQPILQAKCVACHGAAMPQAKLDLRSPESILKGGASGPVIKPGGSENSLLVTKIITGQMPPGPKKLTAVEIDQIRGWIDRTLPAEAKANTPVVTEREVTAILQARCIRCHGALEKRGGLDLRTMASRLKGGKSGPALVPGKPEESLMLKRIVSGQMPPDKMAKDLAIELPTDAEIEKIRNWIAAGAPGVEAQPAPTTALVKDDDRKFWSFQPPVRPAVPAVKNANWYAIRSTRFCWRSWKQRIEYSPEASRLTLMRRVYLDLVGIPPTQAGDRRVCERHFAHRI